MLPSKPILQQINLMEESSQHTNTPQSNNSVANNFNNLCYFIKDKFTNVYDLAKKSYSSLKDSKVSHLIQRSIQKLKKKPQSKQELNQQQIVSSPLIKKDQKNEKIKNKLENSDQNNIQPQSNSKQNIFKQYSGLKIDFSNASPIKKINKNNLQKSNNSFNLSQSLIVLQSSQKNGKNHKQPLKGQVPRKKRKINKDTYLQIAKLKSQTFSQIKSKIAKQKCNDNDSSSSQQQGNKKNEFDLILKQRDSSKQIQRQIQKQQPYRISQGLKNNQSDNFKQIKDKLKKIFTIQQLIQILNKTKDNAQKQLENNNNYHQSINQQVERKNVPVFSQFPSLFANKPMQKKTEVEIKQTPIFSANSIPTTHQNINRIPTLFGPNIIQPPPENLFQRESNKLTTPIKDIFKKQSESGEKPNPFKIVGSPKGIKFTDLIDGQKDKNSKDNLKVSFQTPSQKILQNSEQTPFKQMCDQSQEPESVQNIKNNSNSYGQFPNYIDNPPPPFANSIPPQVSFFQNASMLFSNNQSNEVMNLFMPNPQKQSLFSQQNNNTRANKSKKKDNQPRIG